MPTYTPLQSIQLMSSSSTVTFSNIPQTYQDLVIVVNGTVNSGSYFTFRLNGDTGNNYSNTEMDGTGGAASTNRNANNSYMYNSSIFTTQTGIINHIQNYSNTTTNKNILSKNNNPASQVKVSVGLWRNTSAINSIEMGTGGSNTFQTGTTFDLYGISPVAADTAQAFGGTEVYYDSSYVYHVFKGSGTFTPYRALTADVLVIAGGGGASADRSGGGGAGGLRLLTSQSLTTINYTVIVGAGGSGTVFTANGFNGGNSSFAGSGFSTISSTGGGGGGGSQAPNAGSAGGSGGGGGWRANQPGGAGNAGGYTPVEGYAGGNSNQQSTAGTGAGGGGGGAGGIGATASTLNIGGNGGVGATSATINAFGTATSTGQLSGGNYYYAGGGGGGGQDNFGTGGLGGGANGSIAVSSVGNSGVTNTGGGGGGIYDGTGGNGGSGLVIVRYAR